MRHYNELREELHKMLDAFPSVVETPIGYFLKDTAVPVSDVVGWLSTGKGKKAVMTKLNINKVQVSDALAFAAAYVMTIK